VRASSAADVAEMHGFSSVVPEAEGDDPEGLGVRFAPAPPSAQFMRL
jgi:hypothetical protein